MSAERLREAAAAMRSDWPAVPGDDAETALFYASVAQLLDNEAALIDSTEKYPDLYMPVNGARVALLTEVADAYFGSDR